MWVRDCLNANLTFGILSGDAVEDDLCRYSAFDEHPDTVDSQDMPGAEADTHGDDGRRQDGLGGDDATCRQPQSLTALLLSHSLQMCDIITACRDVYISSAPRLLPHDPKQAQLTLVPHTATRHSAIHLCKSVLDCLVDVELDYHLDP